MSKDTSKNPYVVRKFAVTQSEKTSKQQQQQQ